MTKSTKSERRDYESAKERGMLGSQVVYKSRPATPAQLDAIRSMARRAGYRYENDAVKDVIGKVPVSGLNRERASLVIEYLQKKLDR